jgi:hypothetical protein
MVFQNITVLTAAGNYTVVNESVVCVEKTVGAATQITLPSVVFIGQNVLIADGKGDAATNNITVVPDGVTATAINGAASHVINTAYGSWNYLFDGVKWIATN